MTGLERAWSFRPSLLFWQVGGLETVAHPSLGWCLYFCIEIPCKRDLGWAHSFKALSLSLSLSLSLGIFQTLQLFPCEFQNHREEETRAPDGHGHC